MPQLQDPNFKRTVALLVDHDANGTFGLVLNRPVDLSARVLCEDLDVEWRGDPSATAHWGGPVQPDTGWVLCAEGLGIHPSDESVKEVIPGLFFAGSLDLLRAVAVTPPPRVRLFLGYAGWGPGQLEAEMAQGAWLVAPCSKDAVFHVPYDEMWSHVVKQLGIDPATLVSTRGVH
jgi:putative transcriptional regulator